MLLLAPFGRSAANMKSTIYCKNKNMKSTILQKAIKPDEKRILYKNYPIQTI